MNKIHALAAFLLVGCLSQEHDVSNEGHALDDAHRSLTLAPERDPANELVAEFHEPFRAAVDASLGRNSADVVRAANAARVRHSVECLHMSGYSPSVPDIEALIVVDPRATTTGLDAAIKTVTAGQTDAERLGIPEQFLVTCLGDAENRINPEFALSKLLEDARNEISKQLEADPMMTTAFDEQTACVARNGLRDDVQQFNDEESMASKITLGFLTGDIRQEEALHELKELQARRAKREPQSRAINRCVGQRLSVERALVSEQQRAYLAAHPEWAAEVAASYRSALTALAL